ncbi:MAG: HlyD family secretion protein [Burkholderiaceae bacterium]|nr:HlyD family secretion protein [Burkholderiaceae bacterium]
MLVPMIVALVVGVVYLRGGRFVETDNAYVKADKVPVSAEVSGAIKEVLVEENQTVLAGQPLFRLDAAPFAVAVAKAEAKLAQARTDQAVLKASYREKQAEIAVAQTKRGFANKDQLRQADLVARSFISASRFDEAKQNTDLAAQQVVTLEQDLKRIAETLGGSVDVPVERLPSYRAAQAELDQARLDLARVEVRASLPGTVSKLPKPGQYLTAGTMATALVVNNNLWIEANLTEKDLAFVHPGQPVAIHIDTYPDAIWQGVVDSLSPATGAEFSVIPAQNATGNWVKIAQRVSVRIKLKTAQDTSQLRAGLSALVEIDTGHRRSLLGWSF